MVPNFASQMRVAFSSMVWNTGSSSPGELLMTCSTSEVAVCCSNASLRVAVRWRSSLSSRVFSMAMTAWSAKFVTSSICFSAERANLLAIDDDAADQLALLDHRHQQHCPRPSAVDQGDDTRLAFDVCRFCSEIGNMNDPFRRRLASERDAWLVADDHDRFALPKLPIGRGRILHGDDAKGIVLVDKQIAKRGLADAHRIRQQGLEHGSNAPGELEMTCSTSEVAVCRASTSARCSRASASSRLHASRRFSGSALRS